MAESTAAWLRTLPDATLERVGTTVLEAGPRDRAQLEAAIASHLEQPAFAATVLAKLGDVAARAIDALLQAGVPILRRDLHALVQAPGRDVLGELENHALVVAVRAEAKGMPTLVALAPGMEDAIRRARALEIPAAPAPPLAWAASRRRIELACLVASIAQRAPRLTREGRLHASDLGQVVRDLGAFGASPPRVERRLGQLIEVGAIAPHGGRLAPVLPSAERIDPLFTNLALLELAQPSVPDEALRLVARVLRAAPLGLQAALDGLRTALLRLRSTSTAAASQGARQEFTSIVQSILDLSAVLVIDGEGAPLALRPDVTSLAGASNGFVLALDPAIAAALSGRSPAESVHARGHVQASFDVVADGNCDPSLVARLGCFAELIRADRAIEFRLTRESVGRGYAIGGSGPGLLAALAALSGRSVPQNVERALEAWATLPASPAQAVFPEPAVDELLAAARSRLEAASTVAAPSIPP